MSATHQYFFPCKDLLSPEERIILKKLCDEISRVGDQLHGGGYEEIADPHFIAEISKVHENTTSKNWSGISESSMIQSIPEFKQKYLDTINNIVERYNGDGWRFLGSRNDEECIAIHRDPKMGYITNISIPLIPDYAFFRPTNFYTDLNKESLIHQANYEVFRSPAILNMRKPHNAGNFFREHLLGVYNGSSITFQVMFLDSYDNVKSKFKQKGWLSTTPF